MEQDSYPLTGSPRPSHRDPDEHTWKPLRFLSLYRLTLGALFAVFGQFGLAPSPLGATAPSLFYGVSLAYAGFAIISLITIQRKSPPFRTQVYLHISVDIVAITLLMHASGGMESQLGVLLVVSIAAAGMLTDGRTASLFAALAALALLIEQVYAEVTGFSEFISYPRAGILGATFFVTAILARVLTLRIKASETLAAQRGIDLANMARLTEYIIQQMDAGVLVVDERQNIRLVNGAAWRLLGTPSTAEQRTLKEVSAELSGCLEAWRKHSGSPLATLITAEGIELLPRIVRIGDQEGAGFLIFLEDASAAALHAQQLKLASLGRLTASIAHEIRNPLGAISYAGELLAESAPLDTADHRLTEIIVQQVQRVNGVVESILRLGRRDSSQAQTLPLGPWLERFKAEFTHTSAVSPKSINCTIEPASLQVHFDPNHLHQILWNLCQNGLYHARHIDAEPKVLLISGMERGQIYLDVVDKGAGVPDEVRPHLFEPFFTTEPGGNGLGLYISRELAQCNRARLDYLPSLTAPSRFRISFGPPEFPIGRT